jgi:hypothetical protein
MVSFVEGRSGRSVVRAAVVFFLFSAIVWAIERHLLPLKALCAFSDKGTLCLRRGTKCLCPRALSAFGRFLVPSDTLLAIIFFRRDLSQVLLHT